MRRWMFIGLGLLALFFALLVPALQRLAKVMEGINNAPAAPANASGAVLGRKPVAGRDDAATAERCRTKWKELSRHVSPQVDALGFSGLPNFEITNLDQALAAAEQLRDDSPCNDGFETPRDEDGRGPLDACSVDLVRNFRTSPGNFKIPRPPFPDDGGESFLRRSKWQECLTAMTMYALRARLAMLGDTEPGKLTRADDVMAALVIAAIDGREDASPGELLPYARRLAELDPHSHIARSLVIKLTYAGLALSTDPGERARIGEELSSEIASARAEGMTLDTLEGGIAAAYERSEQDPAAGLMKFVRDSNRDRTDKVYYLAWAKYLVGDTDKAAEYLKALDGSSMGDYGRLARVALYRMRYSRPDESPFLDPSVSIGFNGSYRPPVGTNKGSDDPEEDNFGTMIQLGPTAWGMADKVGNLPPDLDDSSRRSPADWKAVDARLANVLRRERILFNEER